MSTLVIRKKSLKTWLHTDSILGDFIISKFYFNADGVNFQIVEQGQSKRVIYNITDITLYDEVNGGSAETFSTITELSLRLEDLNYPAFFSDGQTPIPSLNDLTNVNITGILDNQILVYDLATNKWVNENAGAVSGIALVDLTDVLITAPSNGQVLTYNSGSGKWENETPSGGAVTSVNGLTGVVALGLEEILTEGDRETEYLYGSDILLNSQRTKYLIGYGTDSITLNASVFSDNSEIIYRNSSGASVDLIAGLGVAIFTDDSLTPTTPISIPDGYQISLKKDGSSEAWYFNMFGYGATNLGYTPSPTNGIVTSDTGTDATLPLADGTNAGLLKPADFTQLSTLVIDLSAKAPLASPALTGAPTSPTQSANDNSTKIATTAYADAKVADVITDGVTTVAPSQNAVFDALALKSDKSRTLYASGASLTGVATESNVQTLLIPANTIQSEDAYTLTIPTYKSATAATITYNVYHGTSSGARTTLIGTFLVASGTRGTTFQRFLSFVSGNMYSNINFSTNTNNPFTATGGALSAQTLAFTTSVDNYITISANPSVTSEVIQVLDMSLTPRK